MGSWYRETVIRSTFFLIEITLYYKYFAVGCPADWLTAGSTCFVSRTGSRTFEEAQDYCQVSCPVFPVVMVLQAKQFGSFNVVCS